jgi:iron complex transport system substrate-binding protein
VGIFASSPLEDAAQLASVDLSQVQAVGEGYGQIKLEKLAALQPDLIVGVWYSPDDYLYGFNNAKQEEEIAKIAPTLGINAHVVADVAIARFAELAEALGVDLDDPALSAARERYEDATQAVVDASASKPDLKVLALYPGSSELYVLVPEDSADLALLQELGANMVDPDTDDPYYEIISWENADRYPADVIVMDERAVGVEETSWEQQPVWQQLPAVEANQIGLWITPAPFSWQAYAAVLEEFAGLLQGSEVVA